MHLPAEFPADEYERRLDERRKDAVASVNAFAAWWAVLHPLAVISLCGGLTAFGPQDAAQLVGLGCVWVLLSLPAVGSAVTTLRHWPVLPLGWSLVGIAPWAVMLAELTPMGLLAFARLY